MPADKVFQFTHPGRGATLSDIADEPILVRFQFTHPGRGATVGCSGTSAGRRGFNSRTPGGVRPLVLFFSLGCGAFQFTHPGRGATICKGLRFRRVLVSIHAPREGCDAPRPSFARLHPVSIHAPREGCDKPIAYSTLDENIVSIHAPREGCD